MKLSYNRAISVSDYMLKQGISSNRISVEGFGFHRPTATNQTEEGRELNRRVEFEPVK
jgi:OOP family OmpA-OmpF porin